MRRAMLAESLRRRHAAAKAKQHAHAQRSPECGYGLTSQTPQFRGLRQPPEEQACPAGCDESFAKAAGLIESRL